MTVVCDCFGVKVVMIVGRERVMMLRMIVVDVRMRVEGRRETGHFHQR